MKSDLRKANVVLYHKGEQANKLCLSLMDFLRINGSRWSCLCARLLPIIYGSTVIVMIQCISLSYRLSVRDFVVR